jgi:hypothetical protein
VTHTLSEAKNHSCRPHSRGSVRRASGFVLTGKSETSSLKTRTGDLGLMTQKSPVVDVLSFMRTAQAAAVCMFLRFFGHTSNRRTSATLVLRAQHDQRNASIST